MTCYTYPDINGMLFSTNIDTDSIPCNADNAVFCNLDNDISLYRTFH